MTEKEQQDVDDVFSVDIDLTDDEQADSVRGGSGTSGGTGSLKAPPPLPNPNAAVNAIENAIKDLGW